MAVMKIIPPCKYSYRQIHYSPAASACMSMGKGDATSTNVVGKPYRGAYACTSRR